MRKSNRLTSCPECGGRLRGDKSPYISDEGTAFRTRHCELCSAVVYSRQHAEEVTGIDRAGALPLQAGVAGAENYAANSSEMRYN